jgi:hypothetical protein
MQLENIRDTDEKYPRYVKLKNARDTTGKISKIKQENMRENCKYLR